MSTRLGLFVMMTVFLSVSLIKAGNKSTSAQYPGSRQVAQAKNWPVQLSVVKAEKLNDRWAVRVQLKFENATKRLFKLDGISAAQNGKLMNSLFIVHADGKEIPYSGAMVKRAHPKKFVLIKAGGSFTSEISLENDYKIPLEAQKLKIVYETFNHFSPDEVNLLSNRVEVDLK